jgi:hypothetical protein
MPSQLLAPARRESSVRRVEHFHLFGQPIPSPWLCCPARCGNAYNVSREKMGQIAIKLGIDPAFVR